MLSLTCFSLAPSEIGEPQRLLGLARLLVAVARCSSEFQVKLPRRPSSATLSVSAEAGALAVAACELLHPCLLATTVDVDQRRDHLGIRPGRRHRFACGLGFERVVVELPGERAERVPFDIADLLGRVEQQGQSGCARLAELDEMVVVEPQVTLLQVRTTRLGIARSRLCCPSRARCSASSFARVASYRARALFRQSVSVSPPPARARSSQQLSLMAHSGSRACARRPRRTISGSRGGDRSSCPSPAS